MNPPEAKRLFLRLFICFLSLTAAIAIISVLVGEFGEIQLKVLATTFSISAASICSMSCAAFIDKKKKRELGITGIVFSGIAATMVIGGIWSEINEKEYWKLTIAFIVLAIALGYAFLLTLPDLRSKHKWSQTSACLFIGILALQIIAAVWGEIDNKEYYKFLAAVSILVVLFTLIVPILMKFGTETNDTKKTLILVENSDGTFSDRLGGTYKLTKVKTEQVGMRRHPPE